MKIAVLGTGRVGSVLGRRWAEKGHAVKIGSRNPAGAKAQQLAQESNGRWQVDHLAPAVEAADVVLLAVPYAAMRETLSAAGGVSGRVVIDCSNPVKPDLSGLTVGSDSSAAEEVAGWAPDARVVKAFNVASSATMANPLFDGQKATMFFCGDDATAKVLVRQLIADLDFEPVDAGPLSHARYLEPLAMLYIHLAVRGGWGSQCAFRMIRR